MMRKRQEEFFDVCSRCKTGYSCCNDTTPPVTEERRRIIESYLKEKRVSIKDPFAKKEYVFPRLIEGGYCVFHDKKTRKCIIHSVKPETCVAGPITFDINIRSGKIEWFIKREKICQLAGIVLRDKERLEKHWSVAKEELLRLVKELDGKALAEILKKDEPETFKIGEDCLDEGVLSKLKGA
ncbi:MAG: YkgJ family cysteine cluster protein [Candidatus Bathyarchaeota archaeon]|nr:YkgJ family cysteine cluster protein [Candidatus Bathyarchaeota archaeon]